MIKILETRCVLCGIGKKANLVRTNKEITLVLEARMTLAYLSTCYLLEGKEARGRDGL